MPKDYPSTTSSISKSVIPDEIYTAIGKIVRNFAEVEDLVNLYIIRLAGLAESKFYVMMGRTNISTKVVIAQNLAKMAGGEFADLHEKLFNATFSELQDCRNAVAHGVFLGRDEDNKLAFNVSRHETPDSPILLQHVYCFKDEAILEYAQGSEFMVSTFENALMLKASRETRLQRILQPLQKAQNGKKSKK